MNTRTNNGKLVLAAQIADEAGFWDARLRAPDCTDAHRVSFAAWRDADPAHRTAFEELQTIVATLRHERSRADVRALRDEALRAISSRRRQRFAWAAAAAGVVAASVGLAVWKTSAGEWLMARFAGTQIYSTSVGERSTFTLEDGSTVELNAQSRIQVDYSESRRSVELVKGQALFNVAKNARRPFIVHAGNRNIVAVGTQFDVRLDSESVQVTLIEGRVRVEQGTAQREADVFLTPGEQLLAKLNSSTPMHGRKQVPRASSKALPEDEISVRDIDVAKVTGWRDGRIFLDDLPLAEAVAEMNKHSTVEITVEDPVLAQRRVNGMFKAGEQEAFVAALEEYFPIVVQHRGSQEIVLTDRR